MSERFVGETIRPVAGTQDVARMASGAPGLPAAFTWRGRTVRIAEVLREWKDSGPCRHGSGERYVRKHWVEARTDQGWTVKLYFERQPPTRRARQWRLFTIAGEALPATQGRPTIALAKLTLRIRPSGGRSYRDAAPCASREE